MNKKASTTLPGTVDKIVKPRAPGEREQAQIEVEGADHIYKEIRIENALTDDLGQEVRMEPGDKVNITIASGRSPVRCERHEVAHKDQDERPRGQLSGTAEQVKEIRKRANDRAELIGPGASRRA
jgi:hypothetical protein